MKKVVRLTESQLVELIKVIASENNMNEQIQPLLKYGQPLLKKIGSKISKFLAPEIKSVGPSSFASSINAPGAVKQLMSKFGKVQMTDYVSSILKPVQNEVAILANDLKRLQRYKKPPVKGSDGRTHDWFGYLENQMKPTQRTISIQKGQPFDFGHAYNEIERLKIYIDNVIEAKQVSPQGMLTLKNMKQNVDEAIKNLESALGQVATRR